MSTSIILHMFSSVREFGFKFGQSCAYEKFIHHFTLLKPSGLHQRPNVTLLSFFSPESWNTFHTAIIEFARDYGTTIVIALACVRNFGLVYRDMPHPLLQVYHAS